MGHFWVPALWKYSRVTNDPRMKDVLPRYFAAGYAADPFREHETVGVYSNSYLVYAYYFTRDPCFLPLVEKELDQLLPFAEPLARPDDIGQRIYNPYAPARTFAGTPRLLWALDAARRDGVRIGPPPLSSQRTCIAMLKQAGDKCRATLWGFDKQLTCYGPDGSLFQGFEVQTERFASEIQPFDRNLPSYEVYLHRVTIPTAAPAGDYVFVPKLELAVLDWNDTAIPVWNAAQQVLLKPGDAVWLPISDADGVLTLESAAAASLQMRDLDGREIPGHVSGNTVSFPVKPSSFSKVQIQTAEAPAWFRIAGRSGVECWVTPGSVADDARSGPAFLPAAADIQNAGSDVFCPGRFGDGLQITSKRSLHIPDHILDSGVERPLFDESQGTIELWVRKQ